MTEITPTAEQIEARRLFLLGEDLKIEAGAGTGKTSTLVLLANSTDRRGQYVAFNKDIVKDSKGKFPETVACNTAHSLAWGSVGHNYRARLDSGQRMKSWDIAAFLDIDPIMVTTFTGEKKRLAPGFLAGVVIAATKKFCQTADMEISTKHFPYIEGLDDPNPPHGLRSYAVNDYVRKALATPLQKAWNDLKMFKGTLPFLGRHDVYLKVWQMSHPVLNVDFILFDEAQDASPVMVDVISRQSDHAQIVWVGDSNQQIYSFTGAVNALQNIGAEHTAMLTQSFRFGQEIADTANLVLDRLPTRMQLTGFEKIQSTVTTLDDPKAILCRTNAAAVRNVLQAIEEGKRPHLVGGGKEIASFARAAQKLMDGGRVEHPELACFSTWGEVQEYVKDDEQGNELRLMVSLIDEFGVTTILSALDGSTTAERADVIVSTAHKSKGLEWESVRIAGDFPKEDKMGPEEHRLLYVAVTRAKVLLDISLVSFFNPPAAPVAGAGVPA